MLHPSDDRGNEGGDRGSKTADGFGRGRWAADRGEEGQAGEGGDVKRITDKGTNHSVPLSVIYM